MSICQQQTFFFDVYAVDVEEKSSPDGFASHRALNMCGDNADNFG